MCAGHSVQLDHQQGLLKQQQAVYSFWASLFVSDCTRCTRTRCTRTIALQWNASDVPLSGNYGSLACGGTTTWRVSKQCSDNTCPWPPIRICCLMPQNRATGDPLQLYLGQPRSTSVDSHCGPASRLQNTICYVQGVPKFMLFRNMELLEEFSTRDQDYLIEAVRRHADIEHLLE